MREAPLLSLSFLEALEINRIKPRVTKIFACEWPKLRKRDCNHRVSKNERFSLIKSKSKHNTTINNCTSNNNNK